MDETIRETSPGAAKRLETSIHDISPRKAGVASFYKISLSKQDRFHARINRHYRINKTHPNQLDPPASARFVEPAGFSRVAKILPYPLDSSIPTDSAHGFFKIEPPSPTASLQLGDLSLEAHPSSRVSSDFIRVRGRYSRGPRALFCNCSVVVLCPPVDF